MVYLYLCQACQRNDHAKCERGHPAPAGHYGGSLCRCGCKGNANWPDYKERQMALREELSKIIKFKEDSKKSSNKRPEIHLNLRTFNELKNKLAKNGHTDFIVDNGMAIVLAGIRFLVAPPKPKVKGDLINGKELRFAAQHNLPVYYVETYYDPQDKHKNYRGKCVLEHIRDEEYYIGNSDINLAEYSDSGYVTGDFAEGDFAVFKVVGIQYK